MKWNEDMLEEEIVRYRSHLNMALREAESGNERLRSYAEAYANRLDSLVLELQRLKEARKGR